MTAGCNFSPPRQSDEEIANLALKLLRGALHYQELPSVPPTDPIKIENSAGYVGIYRACPEYGRKAGAREFSLVAERERLIIHYGDEHVMLERRGPDHFYVDHPDFALFLLRFGREDGEVVEIFHGPDWYTNNRYAGPTTFDDPEEWDAYPGHYRSHNPWLSNFRIILRKGALALITASEPEEPLVSLGSTVFRVGEDDHSPERIRFDTILNGRALSANLSCSDYYRTFTP